MISEYHSEYLVNGQKSKETSDMVGLNENVVNHYNALNQLTQTLTKNYKVSFTYDAEGLRTSRTVNGEKTVFVWDGDQLVMELSEGGKVKKRYIRGNDRGYGSNLVYSGRGEDRASGREDGKLFYVTDPHGNVVQLTDENGKVIKTYEYDSFGNEVNPDRKDGNPFRYCGEYYDKETDTIYLRARYYQPYLGRFLTRDTYTGEEDDPLSLHLYTYCVNDGVNRIDPGGHFWRKIVEGIKDGFIDTYKGIAESVKDPIGTIKEQFKLKNILKNALDPMGFGRLWYGFAKAAINKDTYTIGYLYGGQLGEASLVLIGEGAVKGTGKVPKVLSKGKPPVVKKALNKVKKSFENKSSPKIKKKNIIRKKNYLNTINKLDDLFADVNRMSEVSGKEMYKFLSKKGYDIRPLSKGSLKGKQFNEGGGYKVNWGGDRILQYHPAKGSHHGGAYYKLSSGETGTIRINIK